MDESLDIKILKKDPCLSPSWRHDRAVAMIETERLPSPRKADACVCAYRRFLLVRRRLRTEEKQAGLAAEAPGLCQAYELYTHAGMEMRGILEARILARQTDEEIAEEMGLLPDAVHWYEQLYFNVRERLHARTWILKTIRGRRQRRGLSSTEPLDATELAEFYKSVAFCGGPVVLDHAISQLSGGTSTDQLDINNWLDGSLTSRVLPLALLTVREPDRASAMKLIRANLQLVKSEAKHDRPEAAPSVERNIAKFFELLEKPTDLG
jgi:hypothetical protein